uniref:Paramyosin n=1 Tax=Cuerna arida TaxID=1464854 RepID=A0A1B6FMN3_9HEMI
MKCVPLVFLVLWSVSSATPRGVSNEDIRDAILSLIHMFRDSTDKLERHEYRERVLGDHLKKALSSLDKRQRTLEQNTNVIAATLTRLDERLRNLETKVNQQSNDKDKNVYTVDTMQGSIQNWMTNMESLVYNISNRRDGPSGGNERVDAMEAALSARVDNLASSVERLEVHLLRPTSTAVAAVDTTAIISHIDTQLARLQTAEPEHDWHSMFLGALGGHEHALTEIKQMTENVARSVDALATKEEVTGMLNNTHEQLQEIKYELVASTDKGFLKVQNKLDDAHKSITTGQEELHKTMTDASVLAEGFYSDVQKSYEQLLKEVKGLAKVEQVMIQTADNVLDTKRRIEYGVHQILLEIGDLVKLQMKDLNMTVNKRFDNISFTILDNQNGGLTNLSSKIEHEISQVWRQIGIMYQQLTASAGALDRLQQQTDAYVNGSLQTMDSMEGKVGQITGRMGEVDDNLNYLLGRLSLVTQEFNQIKSGLGEALDSIKSSFKTVQEQIKDVGPGPNPIPSEETDVDNQV